MKRLLTLAVPLLVGVMVMASSSWQVIDADRFPEGLDDTQTAQFAAEVSALILETVDPQELSPEVRAQLQRFIVDAVIEISDLNFQVEQLTVIKDVWLPVIRNLQDEIKALKLRVQSLEDHHEG